jgi:prepilin peptidase CpaA
VIAGFTHPEVVAALGLAVACYTDIRWWKIPNELNLVLVGMGALVNLLDGRLMVAIIGLAAAFAIHFPLWVLGVQKGGDAKLMIGLGAIVGWQLMVETTLWKLILLVPIGLVVLAATGNLSRLTAAAKHVAAKAQGQKVEGEPPQLTYMPFAPVITAGFLVAHFTHLLELW